MFRILLCFILGGLGTLIGHLLKDESFASSDKDAVLETSTIDASTGLNETKSSQELRQIMEEKVKEINRQNQKSKLDEEQKFRTIKSKKEQTKINLIYDLPDFGEDREQVKSKLEKLCVSYKDGTGYVHCGTFLGEYVKSITTHFSTQYLFFKKLESYSFEFDHKLKIWKNLENQLSIDYGPKGNGYCFTAMLAEMPITNSTWNSSLMCSQWFKDNSILLDKLSTNDFDFKTISLEFRNSK